MEHITETQLNSIDRAVAMAEKQHEQFTPVPTRLLRDALSELRWLRESNVTIIEREDK